MRYVRVVGSAHPTADYFTEWLYASTATVPKHTAQCAKTADCRPTILPIHKYPNPRTTPPNHPRHSQSGGGDCALAVFIALHGGLF